MAAQDRARLLTLLNTPGQTSVIVLNETTGELSIIAEGPGPMDRIQVILPALGAVNLLEWAPASWWINSATLLTAVDNDWISVPDPDAGIITLPPPQIVDDVDFIVSPTSPNIGDLLVWNGAAWISLTAGTAGYSLTSNGPGNIPTYQPGGGGGGGGDSNTVNGQTTAGLGDGDIAYISGNDTWLKARSDGTRLQAIVRGANAGVIGTMVTNGRVAAAKFTTAGGQPQPGEEVYLAANADDGGTGAGKLTATAPSTGYLTIAGVCLNNANYAGIKTSVVILDPQSPIEL